MPTLTGKKPFYNARLVHCVLDEQALASSKQRNARASLLLSLLPKCNNPMAKYQFWIIHYTAHAH